MQELVILSYCDYCFQTDRTKVEATDAVEVVISEQKARLDLCERCNREILDPVRTLIRAREAAQRALDKSAGTAGVGQEPRGSRSPTGPLARCGECGDSVQVRHRGKHARNRHSADPEDLTWYFDDVDTVWACSCGLPFPTEHGRNTHARRTGHPMPEDAGLQAQSTAEEPPRPESRTGVGDTLP
jgi:hypothetical protein